MASEGYDEIRAQRRIKSAQIRPVKIRSRSQSPENVKAAAKKPGSAPVVKLKVTIPTAAAGSSYTPPISRSEHERRMIKIYTGPILPEKQKVSSTQKYLRKVMAKERKRAAAYGKFIQSLKSAKRYRRKHRPKRLNLKQLAKETGLTTGQVKAFYEVFDLLDSNGGGSIDADGLDKALLFVGISLTREELFSVLSNIDKYGDGEIGIRKFLQLMIYTERFIESLTTDERTLDRETMLFETLTKYMKKVAANSIVGYYSTKFKKTPTPHVSIHHAAEARLVGLTEGQLRRHFRDIKASKCALCTKSPYRESSHLLHSNTKLHGLGKPDKTSKPGRIKLSIRLQESEECVAVDVDTYIGSGTCIGEKMAEDEDDFELSTRLKSPPCHVQPEVRLAADIHGSLEHIPVHRCGNGWQNENLEDQVPFLYLRKLMPFSDLTTDDIPRIRTNVLAATELYTKQRRQMVLQENFKHWKALEVDLKGSEMFQSNYRGIYNAYSLLGIRQLKIPSI